MLKQDADSDKPVFKHTPIYADGRINKISKNHIVHWLKLIRSKGSRIGKDREKLDSALATLYHRIACIAHVNETCSARPDILLEIQTKIDSGELQL